MKQTSRLAPDYELEYKGKKDDLSFWIKLVRDLGAHSVLELGVGTGRVLFPLVDSLREQVKKAVGIEIDKVLLSQAREKLKRRYQKINSKVRLVRADMRSFEVKDRFDFIFIPFNTFSLIYELRDHLAVLRAVKKHLKQKGHFALEVYAPNLSRLTRKFQRKVISRKEFLDKAQGIKLVRMRTARYYPASQVINNRYDFKKYRLKDKRLIERYSTTFKLYKFFPTELRFLLESKGFLIEHFWGDYERNEFGNDSKKMIVIAKKSRFKQA